MSVTRRLLRAFLQFVGLLTIIGVILTLIAMPLLPRILQVEDEITKADYILPLAGDWHRLIKAAELYRADMAPKLLLSNARIRPPTRLDQIREAMGRPKGDPRVFRKDLMLHLGVPETAMSDFGSGHISTAEEAEALRDYFTQRNEKLPRSIILVTSAYHTRRGKMIFEDVFPEVRFQITAPPEKRLKSRWWEDRDSAVLSVLETAKFLHYLLGGRFRAASPAQ